jgi:hypothetical protein
VIVPRHSKGVNSDGRRRPRRQQPVILVILLYPDGQRREVILAGVPRVGETIRLRNERKPLVIEHILWMESSNGAEPSVLVSVRPVAP